MSPHKPKYTTPKVFPLGELARGSGVCDPTGSAEATNPGKNCDQGSQLGFLICDPGNAAGSCNPSGSYASGQCSSGTSY